MAASIVVWDQMGDPPDGGDEVLCWRSYAHGESITSVPRHLETHAERIRNKYLASSMSPRRETDRR